MNNTLDHSPSDTCPLCVHTGFAVHFERFLLNCEHRSSPTADLQLRPLEGLVVADFSRVLAGPYATMMLADMGAKVIKVESPTGDDTRSWVPPVRPDGVSTYYTAINRNKKSVVLDFKNPNDLATAQALAARADVLIENFKPGGLDRFGLDYEAVKESNSSVIYCSISGFGTTKGASLPGYDLIVQATSGLMSLTGDENGTPFRAGISVFDVMAGLHSSIGILAALRHREQTGQGQHIGISLMASAMSALVNQTSAYVAGGVVPHRMGNAHPSLFPYEPFPTADDDLVIAAGNNAQFRRLCEVLEDPDLADNPRFAESGDRTDHRRELRTIIVEKLKTQSARSWSEKLNRAGVPNGTINNIEQGVKYAETLGLEPVVNVGPPGQGIPGIRNPISFSATPARYDLAPPKLGEHTDEIQAWLSTSARAHADRKDET